MEERKRSHPYDQNDPAPPLKKQATSQSTSANGATKAHVDADMPWKDDLERFQKDAIYRQMQEYKREKNTVEGQLKEMRKKARYHDDHIRIVDQWFKQLIDEVKMMLPVADSDQLDISSFPSSLHFPDQDNFEEHLHSRSKDIRSIIQRLFSKSRNVPPEVADLQSRLSQLLAAEKAQNIELAQAQAENEELEGQLQAAAMRYMVAEKRIDRAKSQTVAKLERQGILGGQIVSMDDGGAVKKEDATTNGTSVNAEELAELEAEVNKAQAVSERQKKQIEMLESENSKLSAQLTELTAKAVILNDDDYAKTGLFKQIKTQYEDIIKKVNNLEAINIQLQEEAVRLQAERTTFRTQVEDEYRTAISDKDTQLGAAETNLIRIRNNRDELLADLAIKKASLDQDRDSVKKVQELSRAHEERIKALESENERLTLQPGSLMIEPSELDSLGAEQLRVGYAELKQKYSLLEGELSSMSTAFQKSSKLATQKVSEYSALEEKVLRLSAEKAKADQKYFAAMKNKETRDAEARTLRMQNTKSTEVVNALKEAEGGSRALLANLEKQLSEAREALLSKTNDHRNIQQQLSAKGHEVGGLNHGLGELKKLLAEKDTRLQEASVSCRSVELEVEELKATLADTKRSLESWRSKGLGGQSEQAEMLRTIAYCTICKHDLKNTVIKTCGHTFCNNCVEERLTSRSRKCPNCGKSFGSNDHMRITL